MQPKDSNEYVGWINVAAVDRQCNKNISPRYVPPKTPKKLLDKLL